MGAVTPFRQLNNRRFNGRTSHPMTMRLLRHRARQIQTREQFEAILATATHPVEIRRMLEPLLAPDLRCCDAARLTPADAVALSHTFGCPTREGANHAPGGIGG